MTYWLLDDGPLHKLGEQFDPSWAWPASTLHVARQVAKSAEKDKSGRRQKLLAMRDVQGAPSITIHDGNDQAASILYGHLRPLDTDSDDDLGEEESIALSLAQLADAVFVTMDKKAAYRALAELGPARVATPYDVWAWMHEKGFITQPQRQALFESTAKVDDYSRKQIPWRYQSAPIGSAPIIA